MINRRCIWIDFAHVLCCIWIIGIWHMDQYLSHPRGVDCIYGECVTYAVLALFFFISGMLSWSGYHSMQNSLPKHYALSWFKKRMIRIYPLFFISLLSLFAAGLLVGGVHISFHRFVTSALGISWLFPPMIPTLWFCSILVFFILITTLLFLIHKNIYRISITILIYLVLIGLYFWFEFDNRILIYYPFYFFNALVDTTCLMGTGKKAGFKLSGLVLKIKKSIYEIIEMISKATFCAYLFHRQFYEAEKMVIGKFNRIMGWFSLFALLFVSFFIQKLYDLIVERISR